LVHIPTDETPRSPTTPVFARFALA
jgi:hypothetical protein